MNRNKKKITVSDVLLALVIMAALIGLSVMFTLNFRSLYFYDVKALDIPAMSGMTETDIAANYNALIDYCNFWGTKTLELPTLAMSEHGRIHFEQTKVIFAAFEYVALGAALVGLLGAAYKLRKREYRFVKLSGVLSLLVPTVLGSLIALNWDWFFVAFHHVAFDNDYWIFDPRYDPVINMLPDAFFMHCALLILALVVVCAVLLIVVGSRLNKKRAADRKD